MAAPRCDRGQAAILLLAVASVLFVSILAVGLVFGGLLLDRTRAQSVADAAALAALDGGRPAAELLIGHAGAVLVSFSSSEGVVSVVVRMGEVTATAAATDAP